MRTTVIGGGYAGLACLLELRRRDPDAELHLVDPRERHLKITHLHETLRRPLADYEIPFASLGRQFRFEHHHAAVAAEVLQPEGLAAAAQAGELPLDGADVLPFDYLVVATGGAPPPLPRGADVYDRDHFAAGAGRELVERLVDAAPGAEHPVTVVGGGASGIQFLFELHDCLHERRAPTAFRLIDREARLLPDQPAAMHDHVRRRLREAGIDYLPGTEYLEAGNGEVVVRRTEGGASERLPSAVTLLFPGVVPQPATVQADRYGRVECCAGGNVYAAGDCARYRARGSDAATAQVAVRQGKHAALNVSRAARGERPLEYFFRELGYVVSLGNADAVGWVLLDSHIVSGLPAFAIKEMVEAQYDLFVAGIDTYLV